MTVFWAGVQVESAQRRELLQALGAWGAAARQAPGAVEVRLCEDLEEVGAYCLVSEWQSSTALEEHLAGPDFGVLLGALQVLARHSRFDFAQWDGEGEDAQALIRRARMRNRGDGAAGGLPSVPTSR